MARLAHARTRTFATTPRTSGAALSTDRHSWRWPDRRHGHRRRTGRWRDDRLRVVTCCRRRKQGGESRRPNSREPARPTLGARTRAAPRRGRGLESRAARARGDLGVELPLEQVPLVQKRAVELARRWAKPVIVATQMLESMVSSSIPTRAETSDVANAVLDGADALMLSGETSVGSFPVETVSTMAKIIQSTEENGLSRIPDLGTRPHTQGGAVSFAAMEIAELLGSKFVCVFTEGGDSLRRISRLRSAVPVLSFTPNVQTARELSLVWGSKTYIVPKVTHTDAMFEQVDISVLEQGMCKVGDEVVVVAGTPPGVSGSTNTLRVHKVGTGAES